MLLPVAALLTVDFQVASTEGDKVTKQGDMWGLPSPEQQRAHREGTFHTWVRRWDGPPALLFLQSEVAEEEILEQITARWPEIVRIDTLPASTDVPLLAVVVSSTGYWTPFRATRRLSVQAALFRGNSLPSGTFAKQRARGFDPMAPKEGEDWRAKYFSSQETLETRGLVSRPAFQRIARGKELEGLEPLMAWVVQR